MKREKFKNIIKFKTPVLALSVFWGVLVLMFSITLYAFAAWQNPTANPPLNNTSTPINTSGVTQLKSGGFGVEGIFDTDTTTRLARLSGNVGIRTDTPSQLLHVNGTAQVVRLYASTGISTFDALAPAGTVEATQLCLGNGTNCVLTWADAVSQGGGGGYDTVQNNGSSLTQRTTLNFVNGLTATDDSVNNRTNVNISLFTLTSGTGLTGSNYNGLAGTTWALENIVAGSVTQGALWYNGTTSSAGRLDGGTTNPTSTNRLNYNGNFYATNFCLGGSCISTWPVGGGGGGGGGLGGRFFFFYIKQKQKT